MLLFQFLLFLFAVIFFFLLPGIYLLRKTKLELSHFELAVLSLVVGYIFFTTTAYLLLFFHLDWLIFPLLILMDFFTLKQFRRIPTISVPKFKLAVILVIFFIGVAGQLLIISPSGQFTRGELVFWSAHGHDGIWHLALVEEIKKGLPLQNPVFAGERLVNYHYFSDLSVALFDKYLQIPSLDLFFRFFPLLFSVLLGALSFLLGQLLGKNSFSSGIWAMIFTYFAGSFGYLVMLPRDGNLEGESIFWSSQVQSVSGNPPQAIAFVILLTFLLLFVKFLEKPKFLSIIILSLTVGSLVVIKIYAAVVLIGSLLLVGLWQVLREKRFFIFLIFIISSLFATLLYLPNTSASGNLLIFEPWWFIRTMIVADNRLDWLDLELRRQTYLANNNWKWVIALEAFGFFIFLFGNLGMRFLGFFDLFRIGQKIFKNYFNQLFLLIIFFSLLLPLLFVQKGIPGNTIQFMQYFLLLFGILAGVSTARLLFLIKPLSLKIFVSILIIILMIPTQIGLIYLFYKQPPFTKITAPELAALEYLKTNSDQNAVILSPPFKRTAHGETPSIWIWSDTSYLPAFASRRVFISDIEQLDIMGYDYKDRQKIQEQIFTTNDLNHFNNLLSQNKINYLYFPKIQKPIMDLNSPNLRNVFSNDEVEIWKIP